MLKASENGGACMQMITTEELSKALKISQATARALAHRGLIPVIRVGHGMRFDLDEVIETLKGQGHDTESGQLGR